MKTLAIFLFVTLLCLPFTLSAQWTDYGSYITTDDNVGIGVSNPAYSLYVRKNQTKWQGRFANRGGVGADVYLAHGAGYGMHIRGWTTGAQYTLQLYNTNTQTNVFYNNGKVGLGLAGNVGVGTTAPVEKLHINGSVRGNQGGALRISTGHGYMDVGPKNTSYAHFVTDRPSFYFNKEIRVHTGFIGSYNQNLSLRTQGTTHMTILKSNGNVGIGTTNPAQKLHVVGDIYSDWVRTAGSTGLYFQSRGGGFHMTDNTWIRTYGNKNFYHNIGIMRTDGTFQVGPNGDRMIVNTNGTVGIGTTSIPSGSFKLAVNGSIRAKEVKVESGWSDYVFKDDYQLPTLEEEEEHIEENGHLLGFESEEDMESMIPLGDVSRRQQAKIEEMMLHLIEMKKEIDELKKENELLRVIIKTD